ncbi:MAG: D-alanyl-D-alanine carboxypeptidase/D-alanyl-D-alanine-endopeptidase [Phycisphaerales bacterium]|nr:D-alanyl-D-alanine carboxypeptidase/D-alanyl-D-alanine-endopeptidase [Phycisphaerales bacterium]
MGWPGLLLIGFLPAVAAPAEEKLPEASLAAQLESMLTKLPHPSAQAAACVIDPRTGKVIFEFRADQPMLPASANKVFVMAAALEDLGPDFVFETLLGVNGGDLFVVGGGDPGFGDPRLCEARGEDVTAPFVEWARRLKERGLTSIPGRLVLDDFVFEDRSLHATWTPDLGHWYAAPVTGLCINDNCINLTVWSTDGGAVAWSSVPAAPHAVQVISQCLAGAKGSPSLHADPYKPMFRLSGTASSKVSLEAPHAQPVVLFGDALRTVLEREGVTLKGEVVRARVRRLDGSLPPEAQVIAVHRTPMRGVMGRIGRNSQNLFAECLLKHVGLRAQQRAGAADARGGWENGARAVIDALRRNGVDVASLNIADGSGLSRANRCTARQLAATLSWMQRSPRGALLRESLSEPGEDGSLKSMSKDLADRVQAKTGTMNGIRALAGYVKTQSGSDYVFAILFNDYPGGSAPYKEIQTRFCRTLVERLP